MNAAASIISKLLVVIVAGSATATGLAAVGAPAQAAPVIASKSNGAQTQDVVRDIKRHYGVDNVAANRFQTMWQMVQVIDQRTGKPLRVKSFNRVYCQAFPSVLGWSGKPSCSVKQTATGWLITNMAVFHSPRVCIANTCTPAISMTLGSRIYFDRTGTITREEPIGDSA